MKTSPSATQAIYRVHPIHQRLGDADKKALHQACKALGIAPSQAIEWKIAKRSIDARGHRAPRFVLAVDVLAPRAAVRPPQKHRVRELPAPEVRARRAVRPDAARPVIIGMGPAGLFAALQLAEAGLKPVILERGKPVETRGKDVARLMHRGEIAPESNLCFGEGGAGTWSDGKLYTRVGGPHVREVLETLVRMGGPERIQVDARPHLGTDKLVKLLKRFRAVLTELGATIRFETAVRTLRIDNGQVTGVILQDGEVVDATHVILAVGHSARDVYRTLYEQGVHLEAKPFAVGFRVEHPQALIDEAQYGTKWFKHPALPAAYYELKAQVRDQDDRGVYSFCMCPGGSVVPTPTREGEVCVNGMSHAARSGHFANSAIVTAVSLEDVAPWAREGDTILAGLRFQEEMEARAWALGGGAFVAPGQRLTDFLDGRESAALGKTSYSRGLSSADLAEIYPASLTAALRDGIQSFERRLRGFVTDEAQLIGVETRTSAPVTIVRDRERLESLSTGRLYPTGEGAGYGGGIVSAAIDGLKVANVILDGIAQ